MNKKAFQLSISFLVMLIISIVIFGGAIYMIKQFFTSTQKIQAEISTEIQQEIERRLIESGEQVSIPLNKITLQQGESRYLGLGILNMLGQEKEFGINIDFDRAYTKFNELIPLADAGYIDNNWIFSDIPPVLIKNNDYEIVPITVLADAKMSEDSYTLPGIYVFNVCVFKGPAQTCQKGATNLYPEGKINKIYVEVE